jgi:hypothetical protein
MTRVWRLLIGLLAVAALLLILPLLVIALGVGSAYGVLLRLRFRRRWGRARRAILVYSDSPHWKRHIETNWLPYLRERAVVLNWSERSSWEGSHRLEAAVFRHYAGTREFNPVAIVLSGWRPAEVIRFWQPFRDFRHGRPGPLRQAEARLGELLGVSLPAGASSAV